MPHPYREPDKQKEIEQELFPYLFGDNEKT